MIGTAYNAMAQSMDDVAKYGIRAMFTRRRDYLPYDAANPEAFFNELRTGNPLAIETMSKFKYGAFMNTPFQAAAENELLMRGPGWGGAVFGRPMKGLGTGISHAKGLLPFSLAFGAWYAYKAPRREKLSGFIKGVAGNVGFAIGDVIGSTLGGPLVGMAVGMATGTAAEKIGDAFQFFADTNRRIKHLNMGGNYEDTQVAFTMRQRAARELGGSVMNARMYLGREGILFHQ